MAAFKEEKVGESVLKKSNGRIYLTIMGDGVVMGVKKEGEAQ